MARLRTPLFSLDAQGRVGKSLVYSTWRRKHVIRKRAALVDQHSVGQLAQRNWFQECVAAWHQLTDAEKLYYHNLDPSTWPNPGYLNFMRLWLVGEVPNHPADHEKDGKGEISLADLAGSPIGPCQLPGGGIHAFQQQLKPNLVRWVVPGWVSVAAQNQATTIGYLIYVPIFPSIPTSYDRIGIDVIALDAGLARLGIYNWDNGLPSSLVLDAGTVSTTTNGSKEILVSFNLQRQYYFLVIVTDAAPTLRGMDTFRAIQSPVSGWFFLNHPPYWPCLYAESRQGDVAGGLPASAPAPTTGITPNYAFVQIREA